MATWFKIFKNYPILELSKIQQTVDCLWTNKGQSSVIWIIPHTKMLKYRATLPLIIMWNFVWDWGHRGLAGIRTRVKHQGFESPANNLCFFFCLFVCCSSIEIVSGTKRSFLGLILGVGNEMLKSQWRD